MQEYENAKLIVRFDPQVCIHAGACLRGLPAVFDASRDPWIDIDAAPAEAIADTIGRCPSGALSYRLKATAD